jgi:uncharacterized protein YndB with AHSA1/START domain
MSTSSNDRELSLTRLINAPRERVYAAWTQPELLKQWFAPKPWETSVAELDVRPGGSNLVTLRSPQGQEFPHRGVYLEVVPGERLVITSAFKEAWVPSDPPAPGGCDMPTVVILTFESERGQTRYNARVLHWNVADREAHEKMGFHEGWGQCADQLAALVERAGA